MHSISLLDISLRGVREELTYERFCSIPIVVPALEEQKKIVYKYQTIEKLIQNKRKINELLEGWMKSYYHILFDNLEEFTSEILGNLFQVLKGSQPPKSNFYLEKLYFCKQGGIPFVRTKDIFECKFLNSTSEQLTEAGFKRCKAKLIPENGLIFVGTAGRQGGRLLINQLKTLIISPNLWVIEGGQTQFAYFLYLLFD